MAPPVPVKAETICGAFPDAKSKEEAEAKEVEERLKVKLGIRTKQLDDGFLKFVAFYLKQSKGKASYAHDEFRCKVLTDHFGIQGLGISQSIW